MNILSIFYTYQIVLLVLTWVGSGIALGCYRIIINNEYKRIRNSLSLARQWVCDIPNQSVRISKNIELKIFKENLRLPTLSTGPS